MTEATRDMRNAMQNTNQVIAELEASIKSTTDDHLIIELLEAKRNALKLARTLNKIWK